MMSTSLTTDRSELIPPAGSRSWWLLYLGIPGLVVFSGVLAFPELVYERFIWQYLWGPVVADASGEPITRYGIQATEGYSPINTITYLSIVLYSLPGLRTFYDAFSLALTTRLAYNLVPLIIAGGAMRALADASVLGSLAVWFITPSIYFVVAGVALGSIAVGSVLRDHGVLSVPATVGIVVLRGRYWHLAGSFFTD